MEEKKHMEQPTMQQEERQPQSVVISSGLIIQSKLNPAAKEFYPSHVTRRNLMFQEIIKETKSSEKILEKMQNDFTESGCGRVRECGLINFSEAIEPKTNAAQQIHNDSIVKVEQHDSAAGEVKHIDTNLNADLKYLMNKATIDDSDRVIFKNENLDVKNKEIVQKVEEQFKEKDVSFKIMQDVKKNEDNIVHVVDDKVCGDCLTVSEEKKDEKRELEIEAVCEKRQLPECETAIKPEDEDLAAIIKKIEEEIDADEKTNFPNSAGVETNQPSATEVVTKPAVEIIAIAKNVGTAKTVGTVKTVETVETVETAKTMETAKTTEKVKTADIAKLATTTEVAHKAKATASSNSTLNVETNVKEKGDKTVEKEQIKKTTPAAAAAAPLRKESGLKKISKIALSSLKKTTSNTSSHSTASTNSTNTSAASAVKSTSLKSTTSSNMSRTKRISESLHNLSSTFKSKADAKTAEANTTKTTQRSSTTIPKTAVRSRTLINKVSDTNGLKKEPSAKVTTAAAAAVAKDAISLRSTSSTEKSITSKSSFTPSTHSTSSKTLHNKISSTSTKSSDSKSSTSSKNSKDSQKLPRGTVASSLRQTEAQKRRNLFPYDDPETNIELSQFLFK